MDEEGLRLQLEHILQASFRLERLNSAAWNDLAGSRPAADAASVESGGTLYFPIHRELKQVSLLTTNAGWITESERRLIELTIDSRRASMKETAPKSEKENMVGMIREWIEDHSSGLGQDEQELPASLTGFSALYATKVPFLLYGEYKSSNDDDYAELKKLLETFFDGEILLVPLREKEWLILGNEGLLGDNEDDSADEEGTEERLSSLCLGLHAMLSTEGAAGECHASVFYPIIPAKSLPQAVSKLREAIATGRLQRVGQFIHLPWELYLDQLLSPLSHADRMRFIEQVFKRTDPHLDVETVQTLEMFFELDCNVSETAKKLFIHRNTLLYRLDKFKQESGLDVRTFNQAVHVKIALQLYKVTKRP